jgi:hypothetical protein
MAIYGRRFSLQLSEGLVSMHETSYVVVRLGQLHQQFHQGTAAKRIAAADHHSDMQSTQHQRPLPALHATTTKARVDACIQPLECRRVVRPIRVTLVVLQSMPLPEYFDHEWEWPANLMYAQALHQLVVRRISLHRRT